MPKPSAPNCNAYLLWTALGVMLIAFMLRDGVNLKVRDEAAATAKLRMERRTGRPCTIEDGIGRWPNSAHLVLNCGGRRHAVVLHKRGNEWGITSSFEECGIEHTSFKAPEDGDG